MHGINWVDDSTPHQLSPDTINNGAGKATVLWMGHQLSQLFQTFVFIRLGIDLADLREHPFGGGHLSCGNVASFEFKRFFRKDSG